MSPHPYPYILFAAYILLEFIGFLTIGTLWIFYGYFSIRKELFASICSALKK